MAHVNPVVVQSGYRGRNDDGNQATATWKAAQNTPWTQQAGQKFRVRFLLEEDAGGDAKNSSYNLFVSVNGGAYSATSTTHNIVRDTTSTLVADDTPTTQQMTGGTGTFQAGYVVHDGITPSLTIVAGGQTEVEYVVTLGPGVVNGDVIRLRVHYGDGTTLEGGWSQVAQFTADVPPPIPTSVRVSFPTPVTELYGSQTVRARVRKVGTGADPVATLELWENGAKVADIGTATVTSTTGQIVTGTFPAGSLSGVGGSGVEVRVVSPGASGTGVEVESVAWDYTRLDAATEPVVVTGSGAATASVTATASATAPAANVVSASGAATASVAATAQASTPTASETPPSIRTWSTAEDSTDLATSLTVPAPTGLAEGELMIAHVQHGSGSGGDPITNPPEGWTMIGGHQGTPESSHWWFYKIATASEPADYTWAGFATANDIAIVILAITGARDTNPVSAYIQGETPTGATSITLGPVTVPSSNNLLLFMVGADASSSTPEYTSAEMTEVYDFTLSGTWFETALFTEVAQAGEYTRTLNYTGANSLGAMMLSVAPEVVAPTATQASGASTPSVDATATARAVRSASGAATAGATATASATRVVPASGAATAGVVATASATAVPAGPSGGGSRSFPGAGTDRISLGSDPSHDLSTYTLMAWVWPDSTMVVDDNRVFNKGSGIAIGAMQMNVSSSVTRIRVRQARSSSTSQRITGTGFLTADAWNAVAMTYSEADGARAHRWNGSAVVEGTYTTDSAGSGTTSLNTAESLLVANTSDGARPWKGNIGAVAVWSVVLTAQEMAQWAQGTIPRQDALVALLPMDSGDDPETNIAATGAVNNGTVYGTTYDADRSYGVTYSLGAQVVSASGAATASVQATATSRAVRAASGAATAGVVATASAARVAPATGAATLSVQAAASAQRVAPATGAATSSVQAAASAQRVRLASAPAVAAVVATADAVRVRSAGGAAQSAVLASATATRVAVGAAAAEVGVTASGGAAVIQVIYASGAAQASVAAQASAQRVLSGQASAEVSVAALADAARVAQAAAGAEVSVAALADAARVALGGGAAQSAVLADANAVRVGLGSGAAEVAVVATGQSVVIGVVPASGASAASVTTSATGSRVAFGGAASVVDVVAAADAVGVALALADALVAVQVAGAAQRVALAAGAATGSVSAAGEAWRVSLGGGDALAALSASVSAWRVVAGRADAGASVAALAAATRVAQGAAQALVSVDATGISVVVGIKVATGAALASVDTAAEARRVALAAGAADVALEAQVQAARVVDGVGGTAQISVSATVDSHRVTPAQAAALASVVATGVAGAVRLATGAGGATVTATSRGVRIVFAGGAAEIFVAAEATATGTQIDLTVRVHLADRRWSATVGEPRWGAALDGERRWSGDLTGDPRWDGTMGDRRWDAALADKP